MHFDKILSCIQSLTQDVNWRSIYVLCPEVLFLNADLISPRQNILRYHCRKNEVFH